MPAEMKGRRLLVMGVDSVTGDDVVTWPIKAGDYCGPARTKDGTVRVYYLLPIARDEGRPVGAGSLHFVECPPHRVIEEPDGSLTIRESIGNPHWHGFLTEGRWELSKSKP